jgi:hypothetical protein
MALISSIFYALNEDGSTGATYDVSFDALPPVVKEFIYSEAEKKHVDRKDVDQYFKFSDSNNTHTKTSSLENSVLDTILRKTIEQYDVEVDKAILASEDIVKAYNEMIAGHFEETLKALQKIEDESKYERRSERLAYQLNHRLLSGLQLPHGIIRDIMESVQKYVDKNTALSNKDFRQHIINEIYQPPDNPEELKIVLENRIKYYNAQMQMFKDMITINYNILGLTKDEAAALSTKIESNDKNVRNKGIEELKSIIKANKDKYKKGNNYDFRELGMGIMLLQDKEDPLVNTASDLFVHNIQYLQNYDCIISAHGGEHFNPGYKKKSDKYLAQAKAEVDKVKEEYDKIFKRRDELKKIVQDISIGKYKVEGGKIGELQKEREKLDNQLKALDAQYDELRDTRKTLMSKKREELTDDERKQLSEIHNQLSQIDNAADDLIDKGLECSKKIDRIIANGYSDSGVDDIIKEIKEVNKNAKECEAKISDKIDQVNKTLTAKREQLQKRYDARGALTTWDMETVTTLDGKKYNDMNQLLLYLTSKGFKKILVSTCNGFHHTLHPKLKNDKSVHIRYAENVLLAESFSDDHRYGEIYKTLNETEMLLFETCEQYGINYNDNIYLNECVDIIEFNNFNIINEANVAYNIWTKIKEFIKRCVGFIVAVFKKMIEFIKMILTKIKDFFKKILSGGKIENKFSKKIKAGAVLVESAKLNKFEATSWKDLENNLLKACETISGKIKNIEQKQTDTMNKCQRLAEQKERSFNESFNNYDGIDKYDLRKLITLL